jgi:hypothetical protein
MIRLLEISEPERKNAARRTPAPTQPRYRERVRPEVHLRKIGKDAAAYLRVAHIYMLISMPTDTSTIFGAFQAILLLSLVTGRIPPFGLKVLRIKKFASKIFCLEPPYVYAALRKAFTGLCGSLQSKQRGIKRFAVVRNATIGDFRSDGVLPAPIKNL